MTEIYNEIKNRQKDNNSSGFDTEEFLKSLDIDKTQVLETQDVDNNFPDKTQPVVVEPQQIEPQRKSYFLQNSQKEINTTAQQPNEIEYEADIIDNPKNKDNYFGLTKLEKDKPSIFKAALESATKYNPLTAGVAVKNKLNEITGKNDIELSLEAGRGFAASGIDFGSAVYRFFKQNIDIAKTYTKEQLDRIANKANVIAYGKEKGDFSAKIDEKYNNFYKQIEEENKYLKDKTEKFLEYSGLAKDDNDSFVYDLAGGGASLLFALGLVALTKSPAAAAELFGVYQYQSLYEESIEKGFSPIKARSIGVLGGAAEAGLEMFGLHTLIETLKAKRSFTKIAKSFVIELTQEASQQTAEEMLAKWTGLRDSTAGQIWHNIWYAGIIGGILGGGAGAIGNIVVKATDELVANGADKQKAQKAVETVIEAALSQETADEIKQIDKDEQSPVTYKNADPRETYKEFGDTVKNVLKSDQARGAEKKLLELKQSKYEERKKYYLEQGLSQDEAEKQAQAEATMYDVMARNRYESGEDLESIYNDIQIQQAKQEAANNGLDTTVPEIKQKWDDAKKIGGDSDTKYMNDNVIDGQYFLVEAETPTASHNPNANFQPTTGFPQTADGKTVNDRDYFNDKQAQAIVITTAQNYDSRAIDDMPIVSFEGVVVSGNQRTMASQLAAQNNTDGKYIEYLYNHCKKFGFSPEQVAEFKHPRVVFVPNESLDYDTQTFAAFNASEKKTQGSVEKAVSLGKRINDETIEQIVNIIDKFDTLAQLHDSPKDIKEIVRILSKENIINNNELASLTDTTSAGDLKFSAIGKDFLENLLLGTALKEQTIRDLTHLQAIRAKLVKCILPLVKNKALPKEYQLQDDIEQATRILTAMKKENFKTIADFTAQQELFGSNIEYDKNIKKLAHLLTLKYSDIKSVLTSYNQQAADNGAYGNSGLFGDSVQQTKNDILDDIFSNNKEFADVFFQAAYHGTPHKFDTFSTDKIGTGEGAQAHGWGLYFAEDKNVSEEYRKFLSGGNEIDFTSSTTITKEQKEYLRDLIDWSNINNDSKDWYLKKLKNEIKYMQDMFTKTVDSAEQDKQTKTYLVNKLNKFDGELEQFVNTLTDKELSMTIDDYFGKLIPVKQFFERTKNIYPIKQDIIEVFNRQIDTDIKRIDKAKEILKLINGLDLDSLEIQIKTSGQLFKVDIPEKDVLLDEQKTFEEQPKKVQEVLKDIAEKELAPSIIKKDIEMLKYINKYMDGISDNYNEQDLRHALWVTLDDLVFYGKEKTIDKIKKEVVPSGQQVRIDFVNSIDNINRFIASKNPISFKGYNGRKIYNLIASRINGSGDSYKDTSLLLNKYGIKGITYNGFQDGRAYVIFDDKAVKVLEKYYQAAAMYLNKAKNITDFVNLINSGKFKGKTYYRFYNKDNVAFDLISDTLVHDDKRHPDLTVQDWVDIEQNIDNVFDFDFSPETKYDAITSVKLGIKGKNTKYGVCLEILKNGRILITTGFKNKLSGLGVQQWIDKKEKGSKATAPLSLGQALDKANVVFFGSPSEVSIKQIYDYVKNNFGGRFFQNNQNHRGATTVYDRQYYVDLFSNSDKSTLMHELAHIYLADLNRLAKKVSASKKVRDLKEQIDLFLGEPENDGRYSTEQQEKFAINFESYLKNGQAPNAKLKNVFERFAKWLADIYDTIKDSLPTINNEVKSLFDKILSDSYFVPDSNIYGGKAEAIKKVIENIKQGINSEVDGITITDVERLLKVAYTRKPNKPSKNLLQLLKSKNIYDFNDLDKAGNKRVQEILKANGYIDDKVTEEQAVELAKAALDGKPVYRLADNWRTRSDTDFRRNLRILEEVIDFNDIDMVLAKIYDLQNAGYRQVEQQDVEQAKQAAQQVNSASLDNAKKIIKEVIEKIRRKQFIDSAAKKELLQDLESSQTIEEIRESVGNIIEDLQAEVDLIKDSIKTQRKPKIRKDKTIPPGKNATQEEKNAYKKYMKVRIDRLLKQVLPGKKGNNKVSKFDNIEIERFFEELNKINKFTIEQAEKELMNRFVRDNEWILKDEKGEGFGNIEKIKNMFLNYKAKKITSNSCELLKELYDSLEKINIFGRNEKQINDYLKKSEQSESIDELLNNIEKNKSTGKISGWFKTAYNYTLANWYSCINSIAGQAQAEKDALELAEKKVFTQAKSITDRVIQRSCKVLGLKRTSQFDTKINEYLKEKYVFIQNYINHKGVEVAEKQTLNKMQLICCYIWAKNQKLKERIIRAYGNEQFNQMMAKLDRQDMLWGDILQEETAGMYDDVNAVYVRMYGLDMGQEENYFPSSTERIQGDMDLFKDFILSTTSPSFIKGRNDSNLILMKFDNPVKIAFNHITKATRYSVMQEKLAGIYKKYLNTGIEKTLNRIYGNDKIFNYIKKMLDNIRFTNFTKQVDIVNSMFDHFSNTYVLTRIAGKPSIMIKQLLSFTNYMEDVNSKLWIKHFAKMMANPTKLKEVKEFMYKHSPYLKARYESGAQNEALEKAMEAQAQTILKIKTFKGILSLMTRVGDIGAIVYGGYPMIQAQLEKGVDIKTAFENFEKATLRSQQANFASTLSNWQNYFKNDPILRAIFAFGNTPAQYSRKLVDICYKMAHNDEDFWKGKGFKTLVLYGIEQSFVYTSFTSLALLNGLVSGDWDDLKDDVWLSLFQVSNFLGVPALGQLWNVFVSMAFTDNTVYGKTVPIIDDFTNFLMQAKKAYNEGFDLDFEEWINTTDKLASITTGIPIKTLYNTWISSWIDILNGDYGKGLVKLYGATENRAEKIFD